MISQYFAHIREKGPIRYGQHPSALGVLVSRTDFRTVGMALEKGWSANRLAVYELHIGVHKLDDWFVIIDAEFIPWEGVLSPPAPWPPDPDE